MVTLEQRLEGDEGFIHMDTGGESTPDRGNSKCKGEYFSQMSKRKVNQCV